MNHEEEIINNLRRIIKSNSYLSQKYVLEDIKDNNLSKTSYRTTDTFHYLHKIRLNVDSDKYLCTIDNYIFYLWFYQEGEFSGRGDYWYNEKIAIVYKKEDGEDNDVYYSLKTNIDCYDEVEIYSDSVVNKLIKLVVDIKSILEQLDNYKKREIETMLSKKLQNNIVQIITSNL